MRNLSRQRRVFGLSPLNKPVISSNPSPPANLFFTLFSAPSVLIIYSTCFLKFASHFSGILPAWPLRILNSVFMGHLLRQPKWVSETPSRALATTLSLCDSPWLHQVCPSLTAYVCVCPLYMYALVCSCMVPARIMRLVGASCLGLGLGINLTDGASLGSQPCIWWPGGKLANGAQAHTPHTHTCDRTWRAAFREDPNTFYDKTESANSVWLDLADGDRTVPEGVWVCEWCLC